jgi:hypothetical protein
VSGAREGFWGEIDVFHARAQGLDFRSQSNKVGVPRIHQHAGGGAGGEVSQHSINILWFPEPVQLINLDVGEDHPVRRERISDHPGISLIDFENSNIR